MLYTSLTANRVRGPDAHLLEARHDPTCINISGRHTEDGGLMDPPQKLSLLILLQMARDISQGMEYLASMVITFLKILSASYWQTFK